MVLTATPVMHAVVELRKSSGGRHRCAEGAETSTPKASTPRRRHRGWKVWVGGVPLPSGGRVWGGGTVVWGGGSPQQSLGIWCERMHFGARLTEEYH